MRIDKWLWAARLFKTRTLAAEAIASGRVRIDGVRIKPAREARIGERIEIRSGATQIDVIVGALSSARLASPLARTLYEETAESRMRRVRLAEARRLAAEPAATLRGRPTKREGRALRRVQRGTP